MKPIRTRIAPSPTGEDIHIGNLYTALINFAFAKKNKGKFIIRIEDTDRERFVTDSEAQILNTIKKFGITYDEGPDIQGPFAPYRQSERLEIYKKYALELIERGHAYYCFCSKERLEELRSILQKEKKHIKYDKQCLNIVSNATERVKNGESHVIRLNIPQNRTITFHDIIRGDISFESNEIDDQVLIKSDGYPTYHMAVVVDDKLMEISHVIRAEEWISSTPKHILLYEFFQWEQPVFAHLPILRNPNRSKLSKRKNPVWAGWYLEQGYLPEAVLNYLALMGWSHPEEKEVFDLDEFIKYFELKDINPAGPIFDVTKLTWMNGMYIRKYQISNIKDQIYKYLGKKYSEEIIGKTIPLIQERIKKLSDYLPLCEFFFKEPVSYEIDLSSKKELIQKTLEVLKKIEQWKADEIGEKMQQLAKNLQIKNSEFFMILRIAITGKKISPPLNESMEILGKEIVIKRLKALV